MNHLPTYEELFQAVRELTEENERLRAQLEAKGENEIPLYMNAADLARVLNISKMAAYNLMAQPDFPSIKLNNSSKSNRRVRRDDFLAWQESRKNRRQGA
jgi:hypothetical protein